VAVFISLHAIHFGALAQKYTVIEEPTAEQLADEEFVP
tara:strand:- start:20 stop:133 length:114 start_codon:yes stop_codon:yes gene_type:complete